MRTRLHEAGFKGQGMTIAVIDAGFHNVDKIEAMKNINILGTRDFVNPEADIYAEKAVTECPCFPAYGNGINRM